MVGAVSIEVILWEVIRSFKYAQTGEFWIITSVEIIYLEG